MKKYKASQDFVPIKEIKEGVILAKDGSLKAISMVSSLNFSLKSIEEQNSIIIQFQNFLNSLDFSIQISIQSRRLDIRPYISVMEDRRKEQLNDLIKIQTREYIDFIKNFTESVNIMSKNFFVIVSYYPPIVNSGFLKRKKEKDEKKKESDFFEEEKTQLEQRMGIIDQGLSSVGLKTARLGTEEIIELFYKMFNPGESEKPIQIK